MRLAPLPLLLALSLCSVSAGAHDPVTPKPKLLQNGIPLRQLAGAPGASQVYEIVVPADVEHLTFKTSGGTGDCDLFVRPGAHPTTENFYLSSEQPGAQERIIVDRATPGRWYVLVEPFAPFHGVQLTATYDLEPGAIRVPTMVPAPGVFAAPPTVRLKCGSKDATIHFTTDGTPVTAASPEYRAPLFLGADTHLRVKALGSNGPASDEVEGDYVVLPSGTVTPIANARPLFHRAGGAGTEHLFKIAVLAGEKLLSVRTEGGPGDTVLRVRHGAPPLPNLYDGRANGRGNKATCEIAFPAPGDWFISVRGRADYSGVSVLAVSRPDKPDLIVWRDAIEPFVDETEFDRLDCEVQEGTIEAGRHTLLRFDTETRNIGGTDLVMPSPEGNPDFEFQECHGHYHYKGFASYRLLNALGQTIVVGRKVSFCLLDVYRWDSAAPHHPRYTCDEQGIQTGWADIYDGGLPGQWIDITGVPDGAYTIELTLNPERKLLEADYTNNTETVAIELGSAPEGTRAVRIRGAR